MDSDNMPPLKADFLSVEDINRLIKINKIDTNQISDGYHTFKQLYDHRIELWIQLCKELQENKILYHTWRTKKHSDGEEIEGWFLLGMNIAKGKQITYHLPMDRWNDCDFANEVHMAPEFDGHTADDVLDRLKNLQKLLD